MQQAVRTEIPTRYAPSMPGRKVSVVLDEDTLRLVREAAQHGGLSLSAWMARAARYQARVEAGIRACDEFEAENGPFTEEEIRKADEWLDSIGIRRVPD